MSKATILDRLAGAMETLGKREGKALTPRQRVAAAQRWNSLADISEGELDRLYDLSARTDRTGEIAASRYATLDYDMRDFGLKDRNSENRADNPFRLDWMGEPYQYEVRLKNYRPLTDAQYERMQEREDLERLRGFEEFPDDFDYMWRY